MDGVKRMVLERKHPSRPLTAGEQADLSRRGLAAWLSGGGLAQDKGRTVAARTASKAVAGADGDEVLRHFVVIYAGVDVLATYRADPRDGGKFMLRRVTRTPKDLVRLKA